MEIQMAGKRVKAIHLETYVLGTDRILAAAVTNGPDAVIDARIWTNGIYTGTVGLRLAGDPDWTYPGGNSGGGFSLGDFGANEEKAVEIKVNLVAPPGRPGENIVPLFVGHGGLQ